MKPEREDEVKQLLTYAVEQNDFAEAKRELMQAVEKIQENLAFRAQQVEKAIALIAAENNEKWSVSPEKLQEWTDAHSKALRLMLSAVQRSRTKKQAPSWVETLGLPRWRPVDDSEAAGCNDAVAKEGSAASSAEGPEFEVGFDDGGFTAWRANKNRNLNIPQKCQGPSEMISGHPVTFEMVQLNPWNT